MRSSFVPLLSLLLSFAALAPVVLGADCPVGFYCIDGYQIPCSLGSYCPAGTLEDVPCAQGQYCSDPTSSANCPSGRWGSTPGLSAASQCAECPAGTYSNGVSGQQTATAACTLCPVGRWSSLSRLTTVNQCATCPAGRSGLKDGAASDAEGCAPTCTATAPPALGGGVGNCAGVAAQGVSTCWQTCPANKGISGQATCSGNTFTSQSCTDCKTGEVYTGRSQESLVKYQEGGTAGTSQYQGGAVSISADGRVMVQGAWNDNDGRGGQWARDERGVLTRVAARCMMS
jgi:hypothetical protein